MLNEYKKQIEELKQSISLTGDNSIVGLKNRRLIAITIKEKLDEWLIHNVNSQESIIVKQLITELVEISRYENWGKIILPYTSGIIKKSQLRFNDYENSSKYGGIDELSENQNLFERRYYIGISPMNNYVTEDLVVVRADTPPNFNEYWHLHTDTDEIVTCFGYYQVIYQSNNQINTVNYVKNDILFVNKGTRHSMQSIDSIPNSNFCVKTADKIADQNRSMMSFTTRNSEPKAFAIPLVIKDTSNYSSDGLGLDIPYVINSIDLEYGQKLSIKNNAQSLIWIVKGQGQVVLNNEIAKKFKHTLDNQLSEGDVIILDKLTPVEIRANSKLTMFMVIKNTLTM